jgi:hypothetical protein
MHPLLPHFPPSLLHEWVCTLHQLGINFYGFYCLLPIIIIIITLGDIYLALLCIVINIVINMLFYCLYLKGLVLGHI